jgi:hypothetical protein
MGKPKAYKCPYCGTWRNPEAVFRAHLYYAHCILDANISGEEDFTRVIIYETPNTRNGPMDTNVPVTEAEMTGFFGRMSTTFVSLSKQAAELDGVKQALAELTTRLDGIVADNTRLQRERDDALMKELQAQEERDATQRTLREIEQRHSAVLDTMVRRDSRINELEGLLTSQQLETQDWQRKHDSLTRELEQERTVLSTVRERRNHWQERAEAAERSLGEARKVIEDMKAQAKAIFNLIDQPKPAPEVVEEVKQEIKEAPAPSDPSPSSSPSSIGESLTTSQQPSSEGSAAEPDPRPWWASNQSQVG